jgi:hypothetical protein
MVEKFKEQVSFENGGESQIDGIIPDGPVKISARPPAVVSVPINKIMPNRVQVRYILPPEINNKFHNRQINCFEAGEEFSVLADSGPIVNKLYGDLLRLGRSISETGQILPVVGVWERSETGDLFFNLFLGARRFWGLVLHTNNSKNKDIPNLFALEVDESRKENLSILNIHQSSLSEIELSKAVAGMFLELFGVKQDVAETELDHYSKVFSKRRISNKIWKEVEKVFGVDQEKAEKLINYLKLPKKVLYLAASSNLNTEELSDLLGKSELEQIADIQKHFIENKFSETEAIVDFPGPIETRSKAEMMVESILQWFELSTERGSEKDFLDVAALMMEQVGDVQELELVARRLINLARDIRVTKTRI